MVQWASASCFQKGKVGRPATMWTRRRRERGRRGQAAEQGQSARRGRPVVISLDGASSSDSEEQLPAKPVKKPKEQPMLDLHITLSPDKMSRGIMSDSSASECESDQLAAASPVSRVSCPSDSIASDTSDDIFDINYSAHSKQAFKGAIKEFSSAEAEQSLQPISVNFTSNPVCTADTDDCHVEDELVTPQKKQDSSEHSDYPPSSPVMFEMNELDQGEESCHNTRRKTRKKNDRAISKSMSQLEEFSKTHKNNESLNLSSDVIISDDEDDVNPEIRVRIKWGSEIFRLPIRKLQKFSHLYEALAQKYGVSTDRVLLNLNDKIINPSLCPGDLNVTIVDVIEGGVQSLQSCSSNQATPEVTQDSDTIAIRLQNSKKRGTITIHLGLKEKMIVLMHKYAEEKQIQLDKLRFMFDGEPLHPRSTPSSLDMEGGECIDVYELT